MAGNLLEVRNLKKYYSVKSGFLNKDCRSVKAVDGINLSVKQGEILGIVGESGCGKSTLGRSILRLIEPTSGEVIFEGTNICGLKKEEMRLKRREMQIVFQDPGASLNPRLTVGEIIGEPLEVFHICEGKEKEERIYKLMDLVVVLYGVDIMTEMKNQNAVRKNVEDAFLFYFGEKSEEKQDA